MAWSFSDDKPIFQQIVDIITVKILSGQYRSGDKLLPVREFAVEAGVNPNTMQRALTAIEETGLIYTRRGDGRYVAENLAVADEIRKEYVKQNTKEYILRLRALGLDDEEILGAVNTGLKKGGN